MGLVLNSQVNLQLLLELQAKITQAIPRDQTNGAKAA